MIYELQGFFGGGGKRGKWWERGVGSSLDGVMCIFPRPWSGRLPASGVG